MRKLCCGIVPFRCSQLFFRLSSDVRSIPSFTKFIHCLWTQNLKYWPIRILLSRRRPLIGQYVRFSVLWHCLNLVELGSDLAYGSLSTSCLSMSGCVEGSGSVSIRRALFRFHLPVRCPLSRYQLFMSSIVACVCKCVTTWNRYECNRLKKTTNVCQPTDV